MSFSVTDYLHSFTNMIGFPTVKKIQGFFPAAWFVIAVLAISSILIDVKAILLNFFVVLQTEYK